MLKKTYSGKKYECGVDEAGRGCLAGPVFAAAVILDENTEIKELDDSKKLTEKKRYELRELIINSAVSWAVGIVDNQEIDKINILKASIKAMHKAIEKLSIMPDFIIVDGNKFYDYPGIPHKTIVKGDGKYLSIAAASILAKTFRDDFMIKIDKEFPQYGWKQNKGYPTAKHKAAVLEFGLTKYHRKTFCSFYFQRKIDFDR